MNEEADGLFLVADFAMRSVVPCSHNFVQLSPHCRTPCMPRTRHDCFIYTTGHPEACIRLACIHSRARSISRCSHGMALTGSTLSDEMEASAVWNKNPGVKARVQRSMRLHYKSVRHHRKAAASHNLGHSMERTAPGSWKPSRTATRLRETAN